MAGGRWEGKPMHPQGPHCLLKGTGPIEAGRGRPLETALHWRARSTHAIPSRRSILASVRCAGGAWRSKEGGPGGGVRPLTPPSGDGGESSLCFLSIRVPGCRHASAAGPPRASAPAEGRRKGRGNSKGDPGASGRPPDEGGGGGGGVDGGGGHINRRSMSRGRTCLYARASMASYSGRSFRSGGSAIGEVLCGEGIT